MGASYGKQKKAKSRKLDILGRWTPIPHVILFSKEYRELNYAARTLLIDISSQYNQNNNGKLVCCPSFVKKIGWNSSDTVTRSIKALLNSGLLIKTREGMMPPCSRAAWYALGWYGLDVTDDIDINPKEYKRCKPTPKN